MTEADLVRSLAMISQQLGNIRADIHGLKQDADGDREEYREQILQLRGDLATMASRQNEAIETNKKKLHG